MPEGQRKVERSQWSRVSHVAIASLFARLGLRWNRLVYMPCVNFPKLIYLSRGLPGYLREVPWMLFCHPGHEECDDEVGSIHIKTT